MRQAIRKLIGGTSVEGVVLTRLEQPGDPRSYTHGLLSCTYVSFGAGKDVLGPDVRLSQHSSQEQVRTFVAIFSESRGVDPRLPQRTLWSSLRMQVVLQAIDMLVRTDSNNVLRYGYRKVRSACGIAGTARAGPTAQ